MGYRGKQRERAAARELRAQAWTLREIAEELGVSRSSVSVWVRDVEFMPRPASHDRSTARRREPNALQRRKQREIDELLLAGVHTVGNLSPREFLMAGIALYAGEGAKRDGMVRFTNSDPRYIAFFCSWLSNFFHIDEDRMRVRLYLHEGLDLAAAVSH